MASLIRQSGEDPGDIIHLKPGINRFGTDENCDFIVDHSSVSKIHCDLVLDKRGLTVRDLNSLRGTLIDGTPVAESRIRVGQTLRLGEVILLVANDKLEPVPKRVESQAPTNKVTFCKKHPETEATFHCPNCQMLMCVKCVHVLKVHGGHGVCLCPECSHQCESLLAKDTRELGQMIDELVMVRNAFAPREHRHAPPSPSETV